MSEKLDKVKSAVASLKKQYSGPRSTVDLDKAKSKHADTWHPDNFKKEETIDEVANVSHVGGIAGEAGHQYHKWGGSSGGVDGWKKLVNKHHPESKFSDHGEGDTKKTKAHVGEKEVGSFSHYNNSSKTLVKEEVIDEVRITSSMRDGAKAYNDGKKHGQGGAVKSSIDYGRFQPHYDRGYAHGSKKSVKEEVLLEIMVGDYVSHKHKGMETHGFKVTKVTGDYLHLHKKSIDPADDEIHTVAHKKDVWTEEVIEESKDPPMTILLRRTAVRNFPGTQRVALYENDQLGVKISVPYDSSVGFSGSATAGIAVAVNEDDGEEIDESTAYSPAGGYKPGHKVKVSDQHPNKLVRGKTLDVAADHHTYSKYILLKDGDKNRTVHVSQLRQVKEEVIDEVSKETLQSYSKKADNRHFFLNKAKKYGEPHSERNLQNREKGLALAKKKLAEEAIDESVLRSLKAIAANGVAGDIKHHSGETSNIHPDMARAVVKTYFNLNDDNKRTAAAAMNLSKSYFGKLAKFSLNVNKKYTKEDLDQVDLLEVLGPSATSGEYIDDFVHSKNKMFDGKSKKQRLRMALGAYYSKKKMNEAVEVDQKHYEFAHGKKPSGNGSWIFTKHKSGVDWSKHKDGEDHIQIHNKNYGDAKKDAVKWANSKGHHTIYPAT